MEIPLVSSPTCEAIYRDTYALEAACCTVELPATHRVMIPMRSKEKKSGLFESTRAPIGVLLTKTMVDSSDCNFWVKAVNLTETSVMLYKNQRAGVNTEVDCVSDPLKDKETLSMSQVNTQRDEDIIEKRGIDLSRNKLNKEKKGKLQDLLAA